MDAVRPQPCGEPGVLADQEDQSAAGRDSPKPLAENEGARLAEGPKDHRCARRQTLQRPGRISRPLRIGEEPKGGASSPAGLSLRRGAA